MKLKVLIVKRSLDKDIKNLRTYLNDNFTGLVQLGGTLDFHETKWPSTNTVMFQEGYIIDMFLLKSGKVKVGDYFIVNSFAEKTVKSTVKILKCSKIENGKVFNTENSLTANHAHCSKIYAATNHEFIPEIPADFLSKFVKKLLYGKKIRKICINKSAFLYKENNKTYVNISKCKKAVKQCKKADILKVLNKRYSEFSVKYSRFERRQIKSAIEIIKTLIK